MMTFEEFKSKVTFRSEVKEYGQKLFLVAEFRVRQMSLSADPNLINAELIEEIQTDCAKKLYDFLREHFGNLSEAPK